MLGNSKGALCLVVDKTEHHFLNCKGQLFILKRYLILYVKPHFIRKDLSGLFLSF